MRIDSSAATSHTAFALLPKYDSNGFVVDWNIEEAWLEDRGRLYLNENQLYARLHFEVALFRLDHGFL